MGLFDFFKKQFVDVIAWNQEASGVLAYRFPIQDREIQNGAQLIVQDTQVALLVNEGQVADIFEGGMHTLATKNLPVLTNLKNWDKGFKSPFKSDVYFFSLKEQTDQRWGTATPITVEDPKSGSLRIRAHGIFSYRVKNPKIFYAKVSGATAEYTTTQFEGQLRAAVLTNFATILGQSQIGFQGLSKQQTEISALLKQGLTPIFAGYGLALESFFVQSISVPEESLARLEQSPVEGIAESIERLHDLLKKGILNQNEFEEKKAALLKRIE